MNESRQQSLFAAHDAPEPMPWERLAESDRMAAGLVFNRPLAQTFHYLVPDELREIIQPGQRVKAPFGRGDSHAVGYCVEVGSPPVTTKPLKTLHSVIDREPLLSGHMLELTRWIAERYLCGWGQVLEAVVPSGVKRKAGTRVINFFEPAEGVAEKLSELRLPSKQRAVLDALCSAKTPLRADEISEQARCGTGPLNALRKKGLVRAVRRRTTQFAADWTPVARELDLELNPKQKAALETVLMALRARRHETLLLHGVTGSGKTEVYMQAIREVIGYGRQAIVLVPEISLTPQTIRRFRSRFESVAVLHSHLSEAERHWHWQEIVRGGVQVVVGARSAVFAPTPHLGLIVIDEEHETTFKQDSTPRYHAREVARHRARLLNVPLILGSATPTLESLARVQRGEDTLISMPHRIGNRPLPPVVVVDIRNDPRISRGESIGRALGTAMQQALKDEGQVILFLNLRGFSPTLWCRACGESVKCPDCDITLTWHRDRKIILCHFCDFQTDPPRRCPTCGQAGMRFLGAGTQRLEHEVRQKFPAARVLRMDSDSMRRHGSHDAALDAFCKGEVDVLLGTQMIAKGLDFPRVTLVGVVDADTMLYQPDLRAAERTFQLISQVAGRTGRGDRPGRVIVQSSAPGEAAVRKAAEHDYLGFAKAELEHRRATQTPPFAEFARVIVRGTDETAVERQAETMAAMLREATERLELPVRLLGPAPAPLAKLRGQHRFHFQLSSESHEPIHRLWRASVDDFARSGDVDFTIDVDPIDMR